MDFVLPLHDARTIRLGPRRPKIMGIVNLTPDSFSDGGRYSSVDQAWAAGLQMLEDGADILDLGAESSRPGALPLPLEEEAERLLPVLEALRKRSGAPISIDTTKAELARQALELKADWINDISSLRGRGRGRSDEAMARLLQGRPVGIILMHMRECPASMQDAPSYEDPLREVTSEIMERVNWALRAGIAKENILIDPGLGFGKRPSDNLALMRGRTSLVHLGFPVVLGASRKSFLGSLLAGEDGQAPPPKERDVATVACCAFAHARGVSIHRVHNVRYARDLLKTLTGLDDRSSKGTELQESKLGEGSILPSRRRRGR